MNKQKKLDLYFGFQGEDKVHKELEETFGELKNKVIMKNMGNTLNLINIMINVF